MYPETLVDEIYEAAVIGDHWPKVLHEMATKHSGMGAVLFATSASGDGWTASPGMRPVFEDFLREGWSRRNDRPTRFLAMRHSGFITEADIFTDAELAIDPLELGFLRPRGLGHEASTVTTLGPEGPSF